MEFSHKMGGLSRAPFFGRPGVFLNDGWMEAFKIILKALKGAFEARVRWGV